MFINAHTIEPTGCEEGAVRIADGLIENEGRLEVCVGGVWGSVCDDGWDKTDAHVACQQLGFSELGNNNTCISYAVLHCIQSQKHFMVQHLEYLLDRLFTLM